MAGSIVGMSTMYLIHGNALLLRDTALQLRLLGYPVTTLASLSELALQERPQNPAVVLLDLGKDIAGAQTAAQLQQLRAAGTFGLIVLSSRGNFESRLAAVRAGADAYLVRPFDPVMLTEKIDELLRREARPPWRVLYVSASADRADALRAGGIELTFLQRPAELFNLLDQQSTDLILIDLSLPECSDLDLIRLIRQEPGLMEIPILLLAREGAADRRREGLAAGADDVLQDTTGTADLIAAIDSRAERSRALRGLISRDSLTGLYNHAAIKEHLAREVSLIERHAAPLSLAMIDLDFFKKVNDTYGHPVGDQVIRALARLLQQRLRRGDIIGRYGGEEFVVLLPATTQKHATEVLADIGKAFAQLHHQSDAGEFVATFSAGVAEAHGHPDGDAMLRSADAALYLAKHAGRNCVIAAAPV
ncbi:diguanylate cyclase (GGDEF)-like protein [Actimicrobium sp. GrIS 1.19]|uniref:GGDEF domain-containing protein n=1 Tax=Actimicrobium sp. GrIS 1.19 TaxID=3071708 RepID=UPI002E00B9F7|nr:diguanylate cyclase (GGDEF)-like protein [Actimicrobium sp. GrIS 1.19]